jgi:hypothetical protein
VSNPRNVRPGKLCRVGQLGPIVEAMSYPCGDGLTFCRLIPGRSWSTRYLPTLALFPLDEQAWEATADALEAQAAEVAAGPFNAEGGKRLAEAIDVLALQREADLDTRTACEVCGEKWDHPNNADDCCPACEVCGEEFGGGRSCGCEDERPQLLALDILVTGRCHVCRDIIGPRLRCGCEVSDDE